MEALVPAFLLAVLSQIGDRSALLVAILSDRFQRPVLVTLSATCAHLLLNLIAAFAGSMMAGMLNPNAAALFLAMALLFGAAGSLWPKKGTWGLDQRNWGMVATSFLGVTLLSLGDRTQFFTLALSTTGAHWFAAAGATVGTLATGFVASTLGQAGWQKLPHKGLRWATGLIFLLSGLYIGLGALRLL